MTKVNVRLHRTTICLDCREGRHRFMVRYLPYAGAYEYRVAHGVSAANVEWMESEGRVLDVWREES